jgi:hypothetical protein
MNGPTITLDTPINVVETKTISNFQIYVTRVELFTTAVLSVECLDASMNSVTTKEIVLTGNDYNLLTDEQGLRNKVGQEMSTIFA